VFSVQIGSYAKVKVSHPEVAVATEGSPYPKTEILRLRLRMTLNMYIHGMNIDIATPNYSQF